MNKIFVIAFAAIVLVGCTARLGDLTIASTENMDVTKTLYDIDKNKRVTGTDSVLWIMGFPFGTPNMAEAIEDAIKSDSRAVGLADITLKGYYYGLATYIGVEGIEAEGNVIHVYEEKKRGRRR